MQLNALDSKNKPKPIEVSETIFGCDFNEGLVHQIVVAYQANARTANAKRKSRSDVRGGGAKPWRQKGTGRARAGTIRSPLWRGGGATFAPKTRNYQHKVNKKMYRGAIRSILSELARQEHLLVVEDLNLAEVKTKLLQQKLTDLNVQNAIIITEAVDQNLYLSARNLPHIDVRDVAGIDPVSLLRYEKVILTVGAVKQFEELLA